MGKLNVLLLGDYGLNGINETTKVVLDDYLEFNHTQFIIQRGGSCVLVPFALRAGDIMRGFAAGNKKGVANMIGVSAYLRDNMEIVDMYQLMAFLLKVPPNPHDGDWDRVKNMLVLSDATTISTSILSLSMALVLTFNN